MIVARREDISRDNSPVTDRRPTDDVHTIAEERGENGMTRDDVFDQLEDEERVITGRLGSRLPVTGRDSGMRPSDYGAEISIGSSTD